MTPQTSALHDDFWDRLAGLEVIEETSEEDRWFLSAPIQGGRRSAARAKGGTARNRGFRGVAEGSGRRSALLARVKGRLGPIDDRLRRGPEWWRHRLAPGEAAM
jgi:hypothetical protein